MTNGFKNVGIVEVVKKARQTPPSDENSSDLPPPELDEDPFTAALKLKIANFNTFSYFLAFCIAMYGFYAF